MRKTLGDALLETVAQAVAAKEAGELEKFKAFPRGVRILAGALRGGSARGARGCAYSNHATAPALPAPSQPLPPSASSTW